MGSSTRAQGRDQPCEIRVGDSGPEIRVFHAQRHRRIPFAVITAPSPATVYVPCSVARRAGIHHQLLLPPEQLPPEQIPPEQLPPEQIPPEQIPPEQIPPEQQSSYLAHSNLSGRIGTSAERPV